MHELPVTEHIIKAVSDECRRADAGRVRKIKLVCGDNSGYVPESVMMYFDIISEGTPCEGAEIEFERVRAKLRCSGCGELFERKPMSFACPVCGAEGRPTDTGREFYIDSIEVE